MIHLYVKTHNTTKLKYFGKTTRDPFKYKGSGKYWTQHLRKHGANVSTVIIGSFSDENECMKVALEFSKEFDIVDSPEWANLIDENGLDGAPVGHQGHIFTDEQKIKISVSSKSNWADLNFRTKIINAQLQSWDSERRERQSIISTKFWDEDRRKSQADKMKSLYTSEVHNKRISKMFSELVKTDEHKKKISEALKGKPKSASHLEKIRQPKNRVCRICDQKEMAVGHYTRWLNAQLNNMYSKLP